MESNEAANPSDDIRLAEKQEPSAEPTETKEAIEGANGGENQGSASAKKKAQRFKKGSMPPAMTLEEASTVITSFYEATGGEAGVDALSSLTNNTSASSVFQRKLATLKNFGLVQEEMREGNRVVFLPDLGLRIAAPHDPAQKVEAQKEAFLKVDVFKSAYERYKGRILPQDEFLINAFGSYVPRELAAEWVEKFKSSAVTAGVIENRNGKLQVRESVIIPDPEKEKEKPPAEDKGDIASQGGQKHEHQPPSPPPPADITRTPIPLGPGRLAYIELPKGWESKDLKKLLRLLTLALGEDSEESEKILSSL